MVRLAVAAEGCAKEAAYHKEKGLAASGEPRDARSHCNNPNGCNSRNASVGMSGHISNWESAFPHEADVDHRGAHRRLACARCALSAGPVLSRPPRSMRELKLAAGAAISRR